MLLRVFANCVIMSRCYALPLVIALKHNHKGNRNMLRCDKGARLLRFKVIEVARVV